MKIKNLERECFVNKKVEFIMYVHIYTVWIDDEVNIYRLGVFIEISL